MRSGDWLDTLDRSRALPAALRGCALLDDVLGTGAGTAQSLPLGRRDAQLLELQRALFGPQLEAVTRCPHCGSSDVAYGPATRNTYGFWSGLLSVLLRFPVRGKRYHCFHCGNEFE